MRLSRPASRSRGFECVKSVNGPPKQWLEGALKKSYSSAKKKVKVAPWSQSGPRDDVTTSGTSGREAHQKMKAYIALGSNLGDRIGMIEKACNEMSARGIKVTRTSSLWETEPMYVLDQGNFINGACEVSTVHIESPSLYTS